MDEEARRGRWSSLVHWAGNDLMELGLRRQKMRKYVLEKNKDVTVEDMLCVWMRKGLALKIEK